MTEFSTWKELSAALNKKCREVLFNDVAPIVEDILIECIVENIYNAYDPVVYARRNQLSSRSNLRPFMYGDNILTVTSVAQPNRHLFRNVFKQPINPYESRLLQWIEFGSVPNYFGADPSGSWQYPRPAVSLAQKEINSSTAVKGAIKRGLDR